LRFPWSKKFGAKGKKKPPGPGGFWRFETLLLLLRSELSTAGGAGEKQVAKVKVLQKHGRNVAQQAPRPA
jgi:hypothetical protein